MMDKVIREGAILSCLVCVAFITISPLARAEETVDGRGYPFQDPLLENLVGRWHVTRTMPSRTAENMVQAEWVLEHQFLQLHYRDVATPPQYEAMVFIGYDRAGQHYVVHWIDVFGGRFSAKGSGKREGNAISFTFEYPDGPFQNTFTFDPKEKTWTSLMRQKDKAGQWSTFAEDRFRPSPEK
jgi:hypothetical protein